MRFDFNSFYTGTCFDAHKYLGVHAEAGGYIFRVYAPSARSVAIIGEWSNWQPCPAHRGDGGVWEYYDERAECGMMYKYAVLGADGVLRDKADPYARRAELGGGGASIISAAPSYEWQDGEWMSARSSGEGYMPRGKRHTDDKRHSHTHAGISDADRSACDASIAKRADGPINIYELHASAFRRKPDGGLYNYAELAQLLVPYLTECGYNYLELLPIAEYPCDSSWGYQATGFFAPTARYGTPEQLCVLIDRCHAAGIGVLLDFVPVHFAVDGYGLEHFDGTALYEYPSGDVGISEWGSCNFMHAHGDVRSFLCSAAASFLEDFHFDGLRVDAVSRIIYWLGDPARGICDGGVTFLRTLTDGLHARFPHCLLCAEDSTAYTGVTKTPKDGGLGFDYKWDMGWMHDTLDYFRTAPEYRIRDYHRLTFSMMYYYGESYILPLSHDESVHGKATVLGKMNGEYEAKFPQARAMYMYMYMHPGAKLNFMGGELGMLREWSEDREMDWDILHYPLHDSFALYMRRLSHIYLDSPALYELDRDPSGFRWLECHGEESCVYVIERRALSGDRIVAAFNFSDTPTAYHLTLPPEYIAARFTLLLCSESECFSGCGNEGVIRRSGCKAVLSLPPFSGTMWRVKGCKQL